MTRSDLHVVAAYFNPQRYQTPARLLREWLPKVLESGATVHLVEHVVGERPFEFSPTEGDFNFIQLHQIRGVPEHRFFLQYPLYNYAIARLPADAKYVCWQDTDVEHVNKNWVTDTLHVLQDRTVAQSWTHAIDLGPDGSIVPNDWGNEVDRSFAAAFQAGEVDFKDGPYGAFRSTALLPPKATKDWRSHTGYSNAMRLDALRRIGKLPDWFVCGSNDYHFWHACAGNLRQVAENTKNDPNKRYSDGYVRRLTAMADHYERVVRQDIGVVPGTLLHGWHGSKKLRLYGGREDVMAESAFDPDVDLAYDVHGMPYLATDNRAFREGYRRYDSRRNADCIRVDA